MTTAITGGDLAAIRAAYTRHIPHSVRVSIPGGYERLETIQVPHTAHTDQSEHYWPRSVTMLLRYTYCHGAHTVYRNLTTFEEWQDYVKEL